MVSFGVFAPIGYSMIIFYKSYKRHDRTLLSLKSVKHLFPDLELKCLVLTDNLIPSQDDLVFLEDLKKLKVDFYTSVKKYNFGNSGSGSAKNGLYFSEGVNKIYKKCIDLQVTGKVLMLDEDHFFTTGETVKHLLTNNFDLAVGSWPAPPGGQRPSFEPNASILALTIESMVDVFPVPEREQYVELLWGFEIVDKCKKLGKKIIEIPTRVYTNYGGDGIHTNNINDIKKELSKFNII